MRQVAKNSYDWEAAGEKGDIDCHNPSSLMESQVAKKSDTTEAQYSRHESSSSDDRSSPSLGFNDESQDQNSSTNEAAQHFLSFHLDRSLARRKASTCSDASSINSTCLSLDGAGSESERNSPFYNSDFNGAPVKYDDIIDKIVELRFSQKTFNTEESSTSKRNGGKNVAHETKVSRDRDIDDVNGNYESTKDNKAASDDEQNDNSCEHEESDGDDLVERGPVRPHLNGQYHHEKPYTLDWIATTSQNVHQNESDTSDYDTLIEEISQNKQLCEKLNCCLDKLSNESQYNQNCYNISEQLSYPNYNAISGWSTPEFNYTETSPSNGNIAGDDTSNARIAPIIPSDDAELLEKLTSGVFQAAESLPDTLNVQYPSPGGVSSEHWPDSPASSRQRDDNVLSPRSHSRASSRPHSPGSSANIGSPPFHHNMVGSPPESQRSMGNFRMCHGLSSSESSNHSFADTPSPLSYQCGVDPKIEDELGLDFDSFSTCYPNYMSSDTVVNSAETIDAIINNELQRVEEAERCNHGESGCKPTEGVQVVPEARYEAELNQPGRSCENNLVPETTGIRTQYKQCRTIENMFDDAIIRPEGFKESKAINTGTNRIAENLQRSNQLCSPFESTGILINNTAQNHLISPDFYDVNDLAYTGNMQSSSLYNNDPMVPAQNFLSFEDPMGNLMAPGYVDSPVSIVSPLTANDSPTAIITTVNSKVSQLGQVARSNDNCDGYFDNVTSKSNNEITSGFAFNEFQIPETVSSFRQSRIRRTSERNITPWPSLNLPETAACEKLKAELDPREVEKAMKNLLKRQPEELAAGDGDGDTMLMCLVGNPLELEKKKAYLVPLVERLDSVTGALTRTNNRNEDALYVAAMHCPQMAYVTGYLGAAMLQRKIDFSRRLYHGETLVHAVAAKGDTHMAVLAELLALRTAQGNSVFDLSQRNYNGHTPLHVAVESHDPTGSGVNSIGVTRLLLENGANPKIQEIKYKNTALHIAVSLARDSDLVKVLLSNNGHGAVNMPNCMHNTPLHIACALPSMISIKRQIQICIDLIRAGGQTNIQNLQGKIPLALVPPERREAIRQICTEKSIASDLVYR